MKVFPNRIRSLHRLLDREVLVQLHSINFECHVHSRLIYWLRRVYM
jgi:hypothetical protein